MKKYQIIQREAEIIRKIAQGYKAKEIGEQFYVSEFAGAHTISPILSIISTRIAGIFAASSIFIRRWDL